MSRPSSASAHLPITPTVPSLVHTLANPTPTFIDAQLPSYLLPSVLGLVRDSARHVVQKKFKAEEALRAEGLLPPRSKGKGKATAEEQQLVVETEAAKRVERIGLMVGGYIAEKLTISRAPFASHLDIIKFVCKDIFLYVYSKQIDNLRTNHRGIFVLQSHAFPPLVPLSSHRGAAADLETAKAHLVLPQALIQGALARLGMPAFVTAESSGLPQCTFQIRTVKSTQIPPTPSAATPAMGTTTPQQPPGAAPASAASAASRPPMSASTGLGIAGT